MTQWPSIRRRPVVRRKSSGPPTCRRNGPGGECDLVAGRDFDLAPQWYSGERETSIAGASHRRRVESREAFLTPVGEVGIGRGHDARGIELGDLVGRERPADGTEVLAQLLLVACAYDY